MDGRIGGEQSSKVGWFGRALGMVEQSSDARGGAGGQICQCRRSKTAGGAYLAIHPV